MNEQDPSSMAALLVTGVGAVVALGAGLREYLRRDKVGSAKDNSVMSGLSANDNVILTMREELNRLSVRVGLLEGHIDELSMTLASVRITAVDCYTIASGFGNCDSKDNLLGLLKQIIKDS